MIWNRRPSVRPSRRYAIASLCGFAIVGAAWGVAFLAHASSQLPQTPPGTGATFTLEGPFTHDNLAVYVVRGAATDPREYITLDEGLASGTVAVHEKGALAGQDQADVNTLEIENRSDKWLFLQAGDVVKGGKQDRTIMTDLTLAPRGKPQPIEAFCVERGRWTASRDGLAFNKSTGMVAGTALKRTIQGEKSQPRVWQEVAKLEGRAVKAARARGESIAPEATLSSTGTYNAIAENKTLSSSRGPYVASLLPHIQKRKNVVGLAVAINGRVTSADLYASPALFQRLSKKLLDSYALEALLAREETPHAAAPDKAAVTAFLSNPAAAQGATETVGGSMQRSTRETDEAVMYEYRHVEAPKTAKRQVTLVHQSYLKKEK